jgi:hypothetical protein
VSHGALAAVLKKTSQKFTIPKTSEEFEIPKTSEIRTHKNDRKDTENRVQN